MPEITVLMPVYNGEAFLYDSAKSILRQTFSDLELLIVDDGSTDQTPSILADLASEDPRVRVEGGINHLGFSGALNLGLGLAKGKYLARMDADDVALPNRLMIQYEYLQRHPEVGLCGGLVKMFGLKRGKIYRPPLSWEETLCYSLFENPFAHPTVMLRNKLIKRHQLRYDPTYYPAEDYELWSRCVRLFPCVNLDQLLLQYRVHEQSLTQNEWSDMDRHAAKIAARELRELGMPAGEDEVRFHRNLGRGRCFPIHHQDELIHVENWLNNLLNSNNRTNRYPNIEFQYVISKVWYSNCYHAGRLRTWMLRRYMTSGLNRFKKTSSWEWLALFHVAIKGQSIA